MSKPLKIAIGIAVLALLALPKILSGKKAEATPVRAGGGKNAKITVTAQIMRPEKFQEKITTSGTVQANEAVELKSEVSGRITQLSLPEGGTVKKGALLVKVYDADLQAQLQKARAALKLAEDKESRQKQLLDKQLGSQEEYDLAIKELNSARADVELLQSQITKTEIRAPYDGRVGLRNVSLGGYLSPGAKIANFVSERPLKVDFSVPEKYFGAVGAGEAISFRVQGSPTLYTGKIFASEPQIDEATRTVRLRAYCTNPDKYIAPGNFAQVELVLREKPSALLLPTEALSPDVQGQKVFKIVAGKAQPCPVGTGIRSNDRVEIISGLSPGDTVVVTGVLMLKSGAAVELEKIE